MKTKAHKGFDKNLKCRDFQYEIGKEYEEKEAKVCEKGFHACEFPLDVFRYYSPADSRFCEVEQDGEISKSNDDSKVASTKIKIGAEIGLKGIIEAGVKFILEKAKKDGNENSDTGDRSVATNTGYRSTATNTGSYSAATNTGICSVATNTGICSVATNTGYRSTATNTGSYSAATNTGDRSAATNTGICSVATNTGYRSTATNTGSYSAATNTGICSVATNTGDYSAVEVGGQDSVAIAVGYDCKAKANLGSAIVIAERGEWNGNTYPLIAIKSAIVDGKIVKADTWYTVKNGEFVEVE